MTTALFTDDKLVTDNKAHIHPKEGQTVRAVYVSIGGTRKPVGHLISDRDNVHGWQMSNGMRALRAYPNLRDALLGMEAVYNDRA